jgi:hypothetical protein
VISNDELFLGKLNDLESRVESGSIYDLIQAMGVVRHLLLDGTSLLETVNRTRRLAIRFPIPQIATRGFAGVEPSLLVAYQNLDPKANPGGNLEINLSQFLSTHCIYFRPNSYSVKELVRVSAHKFGGVHHGPLDEREKGLLSSLDPFAATSSPSDAWARHVLRRICLLVIAGLKPHANAVRSGAATA